MDSGTTWTTWSEGRVGPPLADERAMPAEDRLRRDEERSPAFPGSETGEHADQRSIGPGEPGTGNLAAKHGQLVAKHEDLGILCRSIRPEDRNGLESAPGQTVEQGQGHQGSLAERVSDWSNPVGGSLDLQVARHVVTVVARSTPSAGLEQEV